MSQPNHPSKQKVRAYMERRARQVRPPPAPEEIRRQLGWGLQMLEARTDSGGRS